MATNRNSPAGVSSQAPENNQRLFRRYSKVFAQNDLPAYTSHAQKLSVWLRDHKAYYTAARPEIIKLLLIAQITLRRALGISEQLSVPFNVSDYPGNPMVEAYSMLVKSVEPFQTHFIEPGLTVHIKALMATIIVSPSTYPTVAYQIQSPTPTAATSTDSSYGAIVRDNPPQIMYAPLNLDPEVEIIERPNAMPTKSQTQSSDAKGTLKGSTVSSGKAKTKKRKNINFDLLVQHDIKGLMQKKGSLGNQPLDVKLPEIVSEASTSDLTNRLSTSGTTLTGATIFSIEAGISTPIPTQANDRFTKEEKIEVSLLNEETTVKSTDNTTSINQQSPVFNIASLENGEHGMVIDEPPHPVFADHIAATDLSVHGDEATLPRVNIQPMDVSEDFDSSKRPERRHTSLTPDIPLPKTREPTPMDIGRNNNVGSSLPSNMVSEASSESTVPSTTSAHSHIPNSVQSRPANLSLVSDSIQKDPPAVRAGQFSGIFGSEMFIVARQQGLKEKSRISVQFDIPEIQFRSISNWINGAQDITSSICLTLGCYTTSELLNSAKSPECKTFEAQVSSTRSVWPVHGGLDMNTNFNGSREDIPLSPPFQVTPENLVDVSPFLVLGDNVIELNQRQDLSQYTFVLHAHFPTQAQLKQIEERQQKDKAWKEWLQHISRPLKLPFRPLSQPTLIS